MSRPREGRHFGAVSEIMIPSPHLPSVPSISNRRKSEELREGTDVHSRLGSPGVSKTGTDGRARALRTPGFTHRATKRAPYRHSNRIIAISATGISEMRPLTSGGHRKRLNGAGEIMSHQVFPFDGSQLPLIPPIFARSHVQPSTFLSIKLIEAEHRCRPSRDTTTRIVFAK